MDVTATIVVFIVFATIYGLFELFVRRRERMAIIEKLGDNIDSSLIAKGRYFPFLSGSKISFGALKAGCLLLGIGIGMLVGFFICRGCIDGFGTEDHWVSGSLVSMVNGASILIFGGIGLLVAFFLELKYKKQKEH
ncbi:DUF6249 domain-containing protein [uncultured Odoribacter sp.]|uniref:DUF6249 domain-containing protein n=1 Tax=uncultured Odoribacter sp. TaxID=876416 RepID=UPI00345D79FC